MRISDWSSDVCSSDLVEEGVLACQLRDAARVCEEVLRCVVNELCQRVPRLVVQTSERRIDVVGRLDVERCQVLLHSPPRPRVAAVMFQAARSTRRSRPTVLPGRELGRESCWDRVCQYVYIWEVAVT